jgi:hypothetical protein
LLDRCGLANLHDTDEGPILWNFFSAEKFFLLTHHTMYVHTFFQVFFLI